MLDWWTEQWAEARNDELFFSFILMVSLSGAQVVKCTAWNHSYATNSMQQRDGLITTKNKYFWSTSMEDCE